MTKLASLPMITPEVAFIANHSDYVEHILESERESKIGLLTQAVWSTATRDMEDILGRVEDGVKESLKGVVRITWVNTNRGEKWNSRARIFVPKGPKRQIGSMGFWLGDNEHALRFFGWVWPRRGGREGRREFVRRCKKRSYARVCLPIDDIKRFPGFVEDDGIIWFDEQLTRKTREDDLLDRVRKQARRFFKVARPILDELAD